MKWRIVVIKFQMEENSVGSLLCNKGIYIPEALYLYRLCYVCQTTLVCQVVMAAVLCTCLI